MIKIGETTLHTRRPVDLDAVTLAAFGCTASEVLRQLGGQPMPAHVAKALHPFLSDDDAPGIVELGMMIGAADVRTIASDVAALYTAAPETGAVDE